MAAGPACRDGEGMKRRRHAAVIAPTPGARDGYRDLVAVSGSGRAPACWGGIGLWDAVGKDGKDGAGTVLSDAGMCRGTPRCHPMDAGSYELMRERNVPPHTGGTAG